MDSVSSKAQEEPVWWYHSDHLGSTSYITDILGKPCQYIEYLPFGEVMVQQSTNNIFENVYKFNGKELDESTGYYYYGARYYDPAISIFLSVDPLAEEFPAWNPYHYVHNNPINMIDPTGMRAEPPTEGKYDNGYVHTDSDGSWTYNNGIWNDNSGGGNDFLEGVNFTVQGNNSNLSDAVSAGQMFGGAMAGVMKNASDKYMEKSFYHLGDASHHSNSLKFNDLNYQGPGIGSYSSGYQESIRSVKNLNAGLSVVSKTLDYAGYIEGGVRISQGEYAAGAHSIGNNYLGIKIGASLGWGYGLLYSASYTAFEKTLPKSELYNRIIFGANSPTYNSRRHYWQNSKFVP